MNARVATTKLSSKGQVVIPEEIRRRLGLEVGDQFVVIGEGDVVVLKTIAAPPIGQFRSVVSKAKRRARAVGSNGGGS